MIVIKSHRIMGMDVVRVPDNVRLASFGRHPDFTAIHTVNESNEPIHVVGSDSFVGCTVPLRYIEIYSEAEA